MANSRVDERFENLVAQVHEWTESAVALDEGHFPSELLSDIRDLVTELKDYLDEEGDARRDEVLEMFATPEMAEVMNRFPRVRRLLESAWGPALTELIEEDPFLHGDDDDDDDD